MLARPAALESWLQHFDAMKDTHLCVVDSFDPLAAANPGLVTSCAAAVERALALGDGPCDDSVWAALRGAGIEGWDPDETLMRDSVEAEFWQRAAVFVGGQSTMASINMQRRHATRGMAYDGASKACVVVSQPCPPDPKKDLASESRLYCPKVKVRLVGMW